MWKIRKSQCMWKVHLILTFFSESAGNMEKWEPWIRRESVGSMEFPWIFHGFSMDFPWTTDGSLTDPSKNNCS